MRLAHTVGPAVLLLGSVSVALPVNHGKIHLSDPAFASRDDTYRAGVKEKVKTYLDTVRARTAMKTRKAILTECLFSASKMRVKRM